MRKEERRFIGCHPLLNVTYFAAVITLGMLCTHAAFLLLSFAAAWGYSLLYRGRQCIKPNVVLCLVTLLLVPLLNLLTNHNGETVLFFLNGNRITMEALAFGVVMALMLSSMFLWFGCFQTVMSGDKILYLFGRIVPTMALLFSMVLRFIPLFSARLKQIRMGQRCLGREMSASTPLRSLRQLGKELSILIAWSLEASIVSSDSMRARGYGLPGRSSFHLYRLHRQEVWEWLLLLLLIAGCFFFYSQGTMNLYYYPKILLPAWDAAATAALAVYGLLLLQPLWMERKGEKR